MTKRTKPNGHGDRNGFSNKYERENKYEQPEATADRHSGPEVLPPIEPLIVRVRAEWRARSTPDPSLYRPELGDDWETRRKGKKLLGSYQTAHFVSNAATGYHEALARLEAARQELELASERRALVPLKAEQERIVLGDQIVKARTMFEATLEEQNNQRVERQRRRALDTDDFEIARSNREAAKLEAQARVKTAEARLPYAAKVGERIAQGELRKLDEELSNSERVSGSERRQPAEPRRKRSKARKKPKAEDLPEPLRQHLATERAVQETRMHVDRRASAIRRRAKAESRPLTPEEIEEIHLYESAGEAAEGSIRRGEASDLEE
jgi:hypothetical protein